MAVDETVRTLQAIGLEAEFNVNEIEGSTKETQSTRYIEYFSIFQHGPYYVTFVMRPDGRRFVINVGKQLKGACEALAYFSMAGETDSMYLI